MFQLKAHQERVRKINPHYIQNELMSLDTPGKATVQVVIMRDVNDHEICEFSFFLSFFGLLTLLFFLGFVGAKEFFELAQVDPKGDALIRDAISKDESHKHTN